MSDIAYSALNQQILSRLSGPAPYPAWVEGRRVDDQVLDATLTFGKTKQTVKAVVISLTSVIPLDDYPQCMTDDGRTLRIVRDRVARMGTLRELGSAEVEDAFWVGSALGTVYASAICNAMHSIESNIQCQPSIVPKQLACPPYPTPPKNPA